MVGLTRVRLSRHLGYLYMESSVEAALGLLRHLRDRRGAREDIDDTIRILENFDAFYEYMRRKHKEYIAPRKSEADMLSGRVTIDKVKLSVDGERRATIVFDKRVSYKELAEALEELGFEIEGP